MGYASNVSRVIRQHEVFRASLESGALTVYQSYSGSSAYVMARSIPAKNLLVPLLEWLRSEGFTTSMTKAGDVSVSGTRRAGAPKSRGPAVITARHYAAVEEALSKDPIVIEMAMGLEGQGVPRDEIAHSNGTPKFHFMGQANAQYTKRGGKISGHLGAVASVILKLYRDPTEVAASQAAAAKG